MHVYVCSNHEKKNLILYLSTLPRCTGYHSVYCRSAAYSCDIEVSEYTVDNKDSFILSTTVCFVCVCVLTNRTSHTTPSVDRGLYRFRPHGNFLRLYKKILIYKYTHVHTHDICTKWVRVCTYRSYSSSKTAAAVWQRTAPFNNLSAAQRHSAGHDVSVSVPSIRALI